MTRAAQFVGLLPRNACVLVLRLYRAVELGYIDEGFLP